MKDLILISNYSETYEKQEVLRVLVNQINNYKEHFDLMIVSHTIVPEDISNKCDISEATINKSFALLSNYKNYLIPTKKLFEKYMEMNN